MTDLCIPDGPPWQLIVIIALIVLPWAILWEEGLFEAATGVRRPIWRKTKL